MVGSEYKPAFIARMENATCDVRVVRDRTDRFTRWYIISEITGEIIDHLTIHHNDRNKQQ